MNKETAISLLENLLERAQKAIEPTFLTSREVTALQTLLDSEASGSQVTMKDIAPQPAAPLPKIHIPKISESDIPSNEMLCIDFGTSFSKAFACLDNKEIIPEIIDLPIGEYSGSDQKLLTPSEMIIDEGTIFFGGFARKLFNDSQAPIDRLIDSIKQYMTLGADVAHLAKIKVDPAKDPDQKFCQRDVLLLYLAHLTRLTENALEVRGHSINLRRRFAHPAWSGANQQKNETEMKQMMAEAIVLARSLGDDLLKSIPVATARSALDQLKSLKGELPFALIAEPVREATAAGAGALMNTGDNRREAYLILDIGAGTTDIAGCYCVDEDDWERPRVFEVASAAGAIPTAGNVLDNALTMMILSKAGIPPGTAEYRAAAAYLNRGKRIYKEQLFETGRVLVELPTGEVAEITVIDFMKYQPVVAFVTAVKNLVAKSAKAVAGDLTKIVFVATGGGARLPFIREIIEEGAQGTRGHIQFSSREPAPDGLAETYPDLVSPYPQIAVAVGGALPTLPEQRTTVTSGVSGAPKYVIAGSYKS